MTILPILVHSLLVAESILTCPVEELAHSHVGEIGHVGIDLECLLKGRWDRLIGMSHQSVQAGWLPNRPIRQWER